MSRFVHSAAFLLFGVLPVSGQELKSTLTLDRAEVRLSDSIRAAFVVEGPAPLRVTVPKNLLTDVSAAVWKTRIERPPQLIDDSPDRQRWTLTVRLDPFVRGDSMKLGFTPFEAVVGSDPTVRVISWPERTVRVWTSAGMADDVRSVTGIEPMPPAPPPPVSWAGPILALVAVGLAGGLVGIVAYRRRRRRLPEPIEVAEKCLRDNPSAPAVADAVRQYVESTFAVPATRLTSAELRSQIGPLPAAAGEELLCLLDLCDGAKFAGCPVSETELVAQARRFLALSRTPTPD